MTPTERIIAVSMRGARNSALDAAIELCEEFAKTGHDAECCVAALKDLRKSMNEAMPVPDKLN